MLLLDDLIMLPAKGVFGIIKTLYKKAYDEMYDPENIKAELHQLQALVDQGTISEEEYEAREEILLERLDEIYAQTQS